MSQLEWSYDGERQWEAVSKVVSIDGDCACWRIWVTDDGMFSVCGSDAELLIEESEPFATLGMAKRHCELAEAATEHAIRIETAVPAVNISPGEIVRLPLQEMSLRDWYAGQALCGLITIEHETDNASYAEWAYNVADAMLKARGQ